MQVKTEFKTVLVTVGTTVFDKLVNAVFSQHVLSTLKSRGCKRIIAQIGNSHLDLSSLPSIEGVEIETYAYKDSIIEDIEKADLTIGHAGAGTTLDVLRCDKTLLVVVNNDLMNNHQLELANSLSEDGYLYQCTPETLAECLQYLDPSQLKPFPKQNKILFATFLDRVLST
ncbi:UDP-N-acetylglucosamine transferase subunit ALG13-like protein [Dinothrombium tinctorium]|uniref:UDP-N-acetylglucosamine transferase subunit ALG13 n=1 Tax=Dinothrombium tinctorium TaxID=1965070 RepID=A0A3S3Q999_9ACAR|nr:UDP-N-acetylglucosamine transferase subunit ALG13-like protein [Dinothrombium tinctorium]RWS16183.1 UDP-N-acetylglucosamine transferase subunit ALG13-like protein [Dinothrombium tinctorium]